MTPNPTPENPHPDQAAPAPVVGAAELAANVQTFWEKNRTFIIGACVAGLLAIVAVQGWQMMAESRDRGVRDEFAQAGTDAAKLTRFAGEHSSHPLAGVALLTVADQKFEAGDFRAAAEHYGQAAANAGIGPLLGRARLGEAMSKLQGGDRPAGESALKALAADAALPKPVRAEATYHLASLAIEAGNTAEATKLVGEISEIEPAGMWAQRAAALRATLDAGQPAPAGAPAPASAPPAADPLFKPGGE